MPNTLSLLAIPAPKRDQVELRRPGGDTQVFPDTFLTSRWNSGLWRTAFCGLSAGAGVVSGAFGMNWWNDRNNSASKGNEMAAAG